MKRLIPYISFNVQGVLISGISKISSSLLFFQKRTYPGMTRPQTCLLLFVSLRPNLSASNGTHFALSEIDKPLTNGLLNDHNINLNALFSGADSGVLEGVLYV